MRTRALPFSEAATSRSFLATDMMFVGEDVDADELGVIRLGVAIAPNNYIVKISQTVDY